MRILNEGARLADRYTLVRRLGGGSMCDVWLAEDKRAEGRIALKFLTGEAAGDPRRRDMQVVVEFDAGGDVFVLKQLEGRKGFRDDERTADLPWIPVPHIQEIIDGD